MAKRLSPPVSLALAITSLFLTPALLWVQLIVLFLADMIASEPSNPLFAKVLAVVVVILVAAGGLALPLTVFTRSERVAARVLSGIALGLWVAAQIFFLLMVAGICALDGCSLP